MSKVSHLPKSVPSKEIPFKLDIYGSTFTKHRYKGDFTVRVPGVKEMTQIGVEIARLNDGVAFEHLDEDTRLLTHAIATLRVCLVSAPAWFQNRSDDPNEEGMDYGRETLDANVPVLVYAEANRLVKEWRASLQGQSKEA